MLGPTAEHAWLAANGPQRSNWPSVMHGYRFDDVTHYSRIRYDEQVYYDRNGSLYNEQLSIQTGVMVR